MKLFEKVKSPLKRLSTFIKSLNWTKTDLKILFLSILILLITFFTCIVPLIAAIYSLKSIRIHGYVQSDTNISGSVDADVSGFITTDIFGKVTIDEVEIDSSRVNPIYMDIIR